MEKKKQVTNPPTGGFDQKAQNEIAERHQDITAQKQVEAEPAQLAAIVQSSDDAGKITSISATARDISGRKKAKQTEEELRRSREQLRNLSAYLQAAREQERAHIAREIHDELGQTLTALKLDLSWLSKHLHKDQRPLKEKTNVMSQFVEATIQTVQRIVAELRPGLLDDLGLVAAIDWQTKQFRERTGIACEFMQAPENIVLDRERSTVIFRILQEALTNVTRHARATKVKISLTRKEQRLVLKVRDNGQGITSSQISAANSFGLIGMRERVHPWQGRVKIKGVPNQGTIVYVSLPLDI